MLGLLVAICLSNCVLAWDAVDGIGLYHVYRTPLVLTAEGWVPDPGGSFLCSSTGSLTLDIRLTPCDCYAGADQAMTGNGEGGSTQPPPGPCLLDVRAVASNGIESNASNAVHVNLATFQQTECIDFTCYSCEVLASPGDVQEFPQLVPACQ